MELDLIKPQDMQSQSKIILNEETNQRISKIN